jgi:exopolyphosphatase/guanosine-5'-triphosphate,3'-diphosphate pyrophosphatase
VEHTALTLFDQVATTWQLDADDRRLLGWASRIHEIGLAVAHSQYHQHGAYLIEHSDIAGFSRTEQQFISALVRNQRRGLNMASIETLTDRLATAAVHCALLLRLSVLLHRSHDRDEIPLCRLQATGEQMRLTISGEWLAAHPLTQADLATEVDYLKENGRSLVIATS